MEKIHNTLKTEPNRQRKGSRYCIFKSKISLKEINIFFLASTDKITLFLNFPLEILELGNIIF